LDHVRIALIGAVLLGACTSPPSGTVSASHAPVASESAAPAVASRSQVIATSTFTVDPSAQWPMVVYEGDGAVVRQRTESATTDLARPCGPLVRLEARPAGLLTWCRSASEDSAELRLISLSDGRVTVLATGTIPSRSADVSPDGRSAAAFRSGNCERLAPVCQTRAVLVDVASKAEREILPSGYHLGATIGWTALGLTLFQPECAEAGCIGEPDKRGTFVWDGSAFKRWSDLRFVATSGDWTLLEGVRSFGDDARRVIVRGQQGEVTVGSGHALAIAPNGETLIWRPGSPREQQGVLLRYAPDGRPLWQAELVGTVMNVIGTDGLVVSSPTNRIELYDVKRMLRFTPATPISYVVAGVAR
jgi:hypothetical protein